MQIVITAIAAASAINTPGLTFFAFLLTRITESISNVNFARVSTPRSISASVKRLIRAIHPINKPKLILSSKMPAPAFAAFFARRETAINIAIKTLIDSSLLRPLLIVDWSIMDATLTTPSNIIRPADIVSRPTPPFQLPRLLASSNAVIPANTSPNLSMLARTASESTFMMSSINPINSLTPSTIAKRPTPLNLPPENLEANKSAVIAPTTIASFPTSDHERSTFSSSCSAFTTIHIPAATATTAIPSDLMTFAIALIFLAFASVA